MFGVYRVDGKPLWQHRRGWGLVLVSIILTLWLATSCASSLQNQELEAFSRDQGYRYENIAPSEHNSDSLFVILTFSGGGTRAGCPEEVSDEETPEDG